MFSDEEREYRMQLQLAATRDSELRELSGQVQHLLIPFERLLEDDVHERVKAALAQAS